MQTDPIHLQLSLRRAEGVPDGGFRVLYADPPWSYGDRGASGSGRPSGAESHYETLSLLQIAGIDVGSVMARDSLCFLWVTGPQLEAGMDVMRSWGFEFKTVGFTWLKTTTTNASLSSAKRLLRERGLHARAAKEICDTLDGESLLMPGTAFGQGSYTRSNAEFVLLGRRGRGVKAESRSVRSDVLAPIGAHSEKPEIVAERIDELVGTVPKLELFARRRRPGWSFWGNEVECDISLHVPDADEFGWSTSKPRVAMRRRRRRD